MNGHCSKDIVTSIVYTYNHGKYFCINSDAPGRGFPSGALMVTCVNLYMKAKIFDVKNDQ